MSYKSTEEQSFWEHLKALFTKVTKTAGLIRKLETLYQDHSCRLYTKLLKGLS